MAIRKDRRWKFVLYISDKAQTDDGETLRALTANQVKQTVFSKLDLPANVQIYAHHIEELIDN